MVATSSTVCHICIEVQIYSPGQESSALDIKQLLESQSPRHPNTQILQRDGMSCGGQLPLKPKDSSSTHQHNPSTFNIQNILRPLVFLGRDGRCRNWVLTDKFSYHSSHYYRILLWPTLQSNRNIWKIMLYLHKLTLNIKITLNIKKRTKKKTPKNPNW